MRFAIEPSMNITALFISANQKNSGSIILSMGLMQLLKSKIEQVGFFRPIINTLPESDRDIDFMLEYFSLPQTYNESYGITVHTLESMMVEGKFGEALSIIIDKFEKLRTRYSIIVIEGFVQTEFAAAHGIDINIELAKNLDADVISIINAKNRPSDEILNTIRIESETLKHHDLREFMMFINRISVEEMPFLKDQLPTTGTLYLTPEIPELDLITLYDVKEALGCTLLFGSEKDLSRTVSLKLVAAMSPENFLQHLDDKALVIVPADRSDIITATILALYSKHYPHIAGLLLTGNLVLNETVEHLLRGLDTFNLPILTTDLDTYQSAIHVDAIQATLSPSSERKIALAMGLFFEHIDTDKLLQKLNTPTSHIMTPAMFEYTLFEKARSYKKTIVLPEAEDERILRAAEIILRRGVARIILLGNEEKILHHASLLGLDLSQSTIIDPDTSALRQEFVTEFYNLRKNKGIALHVAEDTMEHGNYFATMLVHRGLADGMVSGAIHTTADTIRPALQIIKTVADVSIVSSVFFMCLDTQVLVYGDCAVNQTPSADELAQIAISSASTAQAFGIEPRIAMLSYSTGDSGNGEEVEKVKQAVQLVQASRPDLLIEGPIQYDAAIDSDVASLKLPHSAVAGKATVFIFPDLNTGNNTYKAVQRSSGAIAIGPVLQGLNKPINDLSRGCSVTDIVNTVAITAIQSETQQ